MDWWPREIVDLVQEPMLGLRNQKVIRSNRAAYDQLGFTQFELLNRPYNRLFRETGKRLYCSRRDGSEFHARLHSAVIGDDALVVLVGNETEKQRCRGCIDALGQYTDALRDAVASIEALARHQDTDVRDSLSEIADKVSEALRAATSTQTSLPPSR